MKRILHLLVLLIIALCFMPAAYAENPVDRPVNTNSLNDIFARHGVNGTLVIYDVQKTVTGCTTPGVLQSGFTPPARLKFLTALSV